MLHISIMDHHGKEANSYSKDTNHFQTEINGEIALKVMKTGTGDIDDDKNEFNDEINKNRNSTLKKDLLGFFYGLLGSLTIAIASGCVQVCIAI